MPFDIRPIERNNPQELKLVAERMGITLVEVLGEKTGRARYSAQWLLSRVKWHLDPSCCKGAIFVASDSDILVGHTIVRVDVEENDQATGLFSTTYVVPRARRFGVANALLLQGEQWMREQGMSRAATNTSTQNLPLIRLYEKHGYKIVLEVPQDMMLRLEKQITTRDPQTGHRQ